MGHVLQAKDDVSGEFLVVNANQIIDQRIITDVITHLTQPDPATGATLGVLTRFDVAEHGAVTISSDEIVDIVEKPPDDEYRMLNAGVNAFSDTIFGAIADTPRKTENWH